MRRRDWNAEITLDRTLFPAVGESIRGNQKGDEARDGSPASSPVVELESAHGAQHGFLRDAAALAVHLHQEDDADDQDDQADNTNNGSPHEGHDEDLCHSLRRRVDCGNVRTAGDAFTPQLVLACRNT